MENNNEKYYVPTIEEFHVGFEYDLYLNDEWQSQPPFPSMFYDTDWEKIITSLIESKEIRVKYLDKNDIESLSWGYDGGIVYYYSTDHFCVRLTSEGNNIYSIHSLKDSNTYCIFQGTIKNKSELHKLMQQLGTL